MAVRVLGLLLYPLRPWLGRGIGNIRVFKWLFSGIVRLFPKKYVVVNVNGCKLGMTLGGGRGFDSMAVGLLCGRGYEVGTTEVFRRIVQPGMRVVDVGAHIGYYTVLASKLVGSSGKVWAFEPEPENFTELSRNVLLNGSNVVLAQQAVGGVRHRANLYVSKQWSGECSLLEVRYRPKKSLEVDVVPLDETLAGQSVDVLKIDVDGGEIAVLQGARDVIGSSPNINVILECWNDGLEAAGESIAGYWKCLTSLKLRFIYLIDERSGCLRMVDLPQLQQYLKRADGVNLLCRKERSGY